MKNKKLLKTLATLTVGAVAAVGCLGFVACGDDSHEHKYGDAWVSGGADGHYHVCTVDGCKEHTAAEAHVYDDANDKDCNTCGYERTVSGGNQGGNQGGSTVTAHNFTYSYSAIPAKSDKGALTQTDFTGDNAFITVVSGVTYRTQSGGCIEVKDAGLKVTFKGTGKITIGFGSTGSSNISGLALVKADGSYVEGTSTTATKVAADDEVGNKAGLFTKQGGTKAAEAATVEFNVTEAGTYTIYCLYNYMGIKDGETVETKMSRGSRIHSIVMVDNY